MFILTSCASIEQKISKLPQEYQSLKPDCDLIIALGMNSNNYARMNDAHNCCLKSIIKMSEGSYKSAEYANPDGTGLRVCPEGLKINSLTCEGSHKWCEPIK
jgi:hypothetical protein